MSEQVKVCPECGDSSILHTSQSNHGGTHGVERYRCTSNNHVFEEPEIKDREGNTKAGNKGKAKDLANANPEEWP
jgi:transposase-like protein